MTTTKELLASLNRWAPFAFQESYDNAKLLTGSPGQVVSGVLVSLDCIESVVDEAIRMNCNTILSHHPILFNGIKSITGENYIERTIIKAIKNEISLIAMHTNLDNVSSGVNHKIAQKLNLLNTEILRSKPNVLKKLITYCPTSNAEEVRLALFESGAGKIGDYDQCSFNTVGTGTYRAGEHAQPYLGERGQIHKEEEIKIELVFSSPFKSNIVNALIKAHPYEEVAYEIYELDNTNKNIGSGMIGELTEPMSEIRFLDQLKNAFQCQVIRHTKLLDKPISKVAFCGGAGGFLLDDAKRKAADVFITGDYKYHEFFDADENIVIMDIGHYESEQYTIELMGDFLKRNFNTFATHLTTVNTNPVNYY
jgi:dinuclear metal center YbgI/SA1388 family protein